MLVVATRHGLSLPSEMAGWASAAALMVVVRRRAARLAPWRYRGGVSRAAVLVVATRHGLAAASAGAGRSAVVASRERVRRRAARLAPWRWKGMEADPLRSTQDPRGDSLAIDGHLALTASPQVPSAS